MILLFAFSAFYVAPSLYSWNSTNADLQNPRTVHITFFYYFNGRGSVPHGEIADVEADLTVQYPSGTLIVDESVTISGLAIVNRTIPEQVTSVDIYFQNAQASPIQQDVNGITKGADLFLGPTQNSSVLAGHRTMAWSVEGSYNPEFIFNFANSTGTYVTPLLIATGVAITVYPKAQIAQLASNNISMILTMAIYVLTLVGTGDLVLDLWDRKPPSQKTESSTKKTEPNTKEHDGKTDSGSGGTAENGAAGKDDRHSTECQTHQGEKHQH